jgi:uncharacterized protein YbaR (Trm112 family)
MIAPELFAILRCPVTQQRLTVADPALIGSLNQQIQSGSLRNHLGSAVTERLDGGLVRADGQWLYPVRGGIPVMLVGEAIPLSRE